MPVWTCNDLATLTSACCNMSRAMLPKPVAPCNGSRSEYASSLYDNKGLLVYRMLCTRAPSAQELMLDIATAPLMIRSYQSGVVYPPVPRYVICVDGMFDRRGEAAAHE